MTDALARLMIRISEKVITSVFERTLPGRGNKITNKAMQAVILPKNIPYGQKKGFA
jgi:hypothetical protein